MKKLLIAILAGLGLAQAQAQTLTGKASYYHQSYEGKTMANGEPYRSRAYTLACWDLPLGTKVKITYTSKGGQIRTAEAVVTDRGPAQWVVKERGVKFDLSWALFKNLENPKLGVIDVKVEVLK